MLALPPVHFHDVMTYREWATKEHPADGDESGAVKSRFWRHRTVANPQAAFLFWNLHIDGDAGVSDTQRQDALCLTTRQRQQVLRAVSGNKKPDNLEPKRRDYRAPQNGDIKEKQWH